MMIAPGSRKLFRFTVQDYERMIDAGLFVGRARVELLGGEIIEIPAMSVPRAQIYVGIAYILHRQAPPDCRVGSRTPILLDDESEPDPDLTIFRRRKRTTHPPPADILLLVEVADTMLDYIRHWKFPRYAAAGIPEAWLFDVFAGVLERHTDPYEGRYRHLVTARRGESLASTTLPDVSLAVDEILIED